MPITFSAESFGREGYEIYAPSEAPAQNGCALIKGALGLEWTPGPIEAGDSLTQAEGDARYWPLSTDLATQAELNAIVATLATQAALDAIDTRIDSLEASDISLDTRLDSLEAIDHLTLIEADARYWPLSSNLITQAQGDSRYYQLSQDLATQVELNALSSVYWPLSTDLATQAELDAIVATIAAKLNSSAVSAFGLTLVDDADAATARTTLAAAGLGVNTFTGQQVITSGGIRLAVDTGILDSVGIGVGLTPLTTSNYTVLTSAGNGLLVQDQFATQHFKVKWDYFRLASYTAFGFSSGAPESTALDVPLHRDAAGTLARRDGTNPQTDRLYGSYTDASNYSRYNFAATPTELTISAEGAGTGVAGGLANKDIVLTPLGTGLVGIGATAAASVATPSTHKIAVKDAAGTMYYLLATT